VATASRRGEQPDAWDRPDPLAVLLLTLPGSDLPLDLSHLIGKTTNLFDLSAKFGSQQRWHD
jgi:hypothetical protein